MKPSREVMENFCKQWGYHDEKLQSWSNTETRGQWSFKAPAEEVYEFLEKFDEVDDNLANGPTVRELAEQVEQEQFPKISYFAGRNFWFPPDPPTRDDMDPPHLPVEEIWVEIPKDLQHWVKLANMGADDLYINDLGYVVLWWD